MLLVPSNAAYGKQSTRFRNAQSRLEMLCYVSDEDDALVELVKGLCVTGNICGTGRYTERHDGGTFPGSRYLREGFADGRMNGLRIGEVVLKAVYR